MYNYLVLNVTSMTPSFFISLSLYGCQGLIQNFPTSLNTTVPPFGNSTLLFLWARDSRRWNKGSGRNLSKNTKNFLSLMSSYHAGMHPSLDFGTRDGTKWVGWSFSLSLKLAILTFVLVNGQIKSYSSRNAIMASSFSFTLAMMLIRSGFVSIPFSWRSLQSLLNPLVWVTWGDDVTSWVMISTRISGLSRTQLDRSLSLWRYITRPCSWKYFKVSSDQWVWILLPNAHGNSLSVTQNLAAFFCLNWMIAS